MTFPKSRFDAWLNGVIEAGWLAALVVAPLFFNVFSSRVFEPDKISLIRSIALVMLLAWLIKLINGGQPWLPAFRSSPTGDPSPVGAGQPAPDTPPPRGVLAAVRQVPLLLPILLLVLAYLFSTLFSVARFVSWWGSYQRLQGTYSFLSYVIIALLTIAHLRSPAQIRRLQHTIVLTSLPIAIYGIIQHYKIDPLPWGGDVTTRVAANAGNAIFLAAYLIMAFFFTLERVYSSFAYLLGYKPAHHVDSQDMPTALAGGAYLFVLLVQLLAIFWTQSRGPWLGLLFGLYLFVLLLFTALRPKHHRLWTSIWIGLGVSGAVLLVLMNTLPLFAPLARVPYVGRLTTMLESEGGTGRVRVLIWQGASELVFPHEPLNYPDGSQDTTNLLRPLVGYGPEAMWIAYNRFYPPGLAQLEARNASPDRSHNETWDALVITGLLGFLAYFALFIAIFYWALRWLGLLVDRRDKLLFGVLLALASLLLVIVFYLYDGGWRFLGVALPAGLILGLGAYVTLSAFLHPDLGWTRADLPRQLLIITILATITAHFIEIHFGIAIAASRTYFWVQTALLVVVGMGWAHPSAYAVAQEDEDEATPAEEQIARDQGKGKRAQRASGARRANAARRVAVHPSMVPTTVMTDALIFMTLVFTYTTNSRGTTNALGILFGAVLQRSSGGAAVSSPGLFFLLVFTWMVAATIGLSAESLQQRRAPDTGWWLRGLGLHALVVWGAWLVYGAIQGARLIPGAGGADLDQQLSHVAGHFALYTWLVVAWLLAAGAVYAWPALRAPLGARRMPAATRSVLVAVAGLALAVVFFTAINTVNIALVRADIIYKQGQQFDNQRNWLTSIELYRRALNARRTEDHYMLFLGRALLEQAKQVQAAAPQAAPAYQLPEDATLDDVLSLATETVGQMGRQDLLRAAEIVLLQAQRVNPLNTDHTANLARLYRSWSDLSNDNAELKQEMLDRSIAQYNRAVELSPNAAHLWNEKGNAHLARGEDDEAEAAYLHSLGLDAKYDQTYMLLADFYERRERYADEIKLLEQGIANLPNRPQIYSYLGVAKARSGDLEGAVAANEKVVELQPTNVGAMRNLAILFRDLSDAPQAISWVERAITAVGTSDLNELKSLRQLASDLLQAAGQLDAAIGHLEQSRQADPNDPNTLRTLYNLYVKAGNLNAGAETLQALAVLEPDNFEHPLALAQLMQQLGQPSDALTYANQAMALAPVEQRPVITELIATINGGG
jgi:tetratricopeptide (TPR) repeat protein